MLIHGGAAIANGASQSEAIDLTDRVLVAIGMPASWTAANLTLLSSPLATGTFQPVYDASGNEVVISAAASKNILVEAVTYASAFIKLRSGTAGTPVAQGAARTFVIVSAPMGPVGPTAGGGNVDGGAL